MRIITSTSVVIFFLVCNITFQENKIEDIIQDNKLLWGIDNYVIEDQHYFDLKINHCFKDVVKETVGSPITYFLYKEGMCKCIIEEIKFKDSESLNLAYSALNEEANAVRTGPRSKFGQVCFELREAQFLLCFEAWKLPLFVF